MTLFRCNACNLIYQDNYPPDDTSIKCHSGTIRHVPEADHQPAAYFYPMEGIMTAITLELKLFTDKDADSSSIHIDSLILVHKGNHYRLKGGSGDTIHAFVQSIALYVLTVNKEHGTIGLNAYMSSEPSPINSFYLHTVKHIVSILGPKWEQLPAIEITQTLIDYLI